MRGLEQRRTGACKARLRSPPPQPPPEETHPHCDGLPAELTDAICSMVGGCIRLYLRSQGGRCTWLPGGVPGGAAGALLLVDGASGTSLAAADMVRSCGAPAWLKGPCQAPPTQSFRTIGRWDTISMPWTLQST